MPLLTVGYVKGRGGATTTALGAALVAPAGACPVLVECDPSGGDLMRRHRLAARPSVVDLAAAASGSAPGTGEALDVGVQRLRVGDRHVDVVVAPTGGARTRTALAELTRPGHRILNPAGRLVVADCGRLDLGSPVRPLLTVSDVVVVLACARADELAHLHKQLADLAGMVRGRLVVLLTPGGTYPAVGIADTLGRYVADELARAPDFLTVAGPLPQDRRAAGVLGGEMEAGRGFRSGPLLSALDRLMTELAPLLLVAPHEDGGSRTDAGR